MARYLTASAKNSCSHWICSCDSLRLSFDADAQSVAAGERHQGMLGPMEAPVSAALLFSRNYIAISILQCR